MKANRLAGPTPRIVVTVQAPAVAADAELARRKNALYGEAIAAAGGEPLVLDETAAPGERAAAFAAMAGLLLTGGADIDPARYGEPVAGSVDIEPGRDALDAEAWAAARARRVPILGVCRGLQAINVFSGGRLIQHLEDHAGPPYLAGPARRHPIRLAPASRLARILRPTDPGTTTLSVNTYHHQGLTRAELAPGLVAAAVAPGRPELVEGLEAADPDDLLFAVQCHPERTESTPPEFARLWAFFVDACRGPSRG